MSTKHPNLTGQVFIIGALLIAVLLGTSFIKPRDKASAGWIYVKESPTVMVFPGVVTLMKGVKVVIAGSGFEKGQELGIRIEMGGVMSDIRYQVKPSPKVKDDGSFHSEWTLGNEYRLISEGSTALTIVNDDEETLAHTPLVWVKPAKKDGKK